MKNKFLSFLLAVAVAFGLWTYVVMAVNPEWEQTYTNIPVVFQNENLLEERELMIVSDAAPTVTLRLYGSRQDLLELNSSNISVICNLASIEASGEFALDYTVYYPGNIANNAISIVGKGPEVIALKVEKKITKKVDVKVEIQGETPADYIDDRENMTLNYTSVEVSGPQSVVDQITQAVVKVNLDGKTQTIIDQYPITLCDAAGNPVDAKNVEVDTDQVSLVLKILRLKDLTVDVEVLYGGGATPNNSFVKWNPVTIKVAGSESTLAAMADVLKVGTVDLSKILQEQTITFDILLPAGVTNVTGIHQVNVDITFPDLVSKTLQITDIQPVNVPDGMTAEIANQVMDVTLRGPKALLDGLTAEDITVVVDLADMQPGTAAVKATIQVDGQTEVGAVGSYNVIVLLQEETP